MSSAIDDEPATERRQVLVDLALQGGGSHGAFTWGVLDRLLEEPWMKIEAISGTSAGAMNAVVLVDGWSKGGPTARGPRLIPIGGVSHVLPPSARCNALPWSG
jgi:predicted acylesterase/phospholipase RssA